MFRGALEAIVGGVVEDIFWGDGLGAVPWLVIILCLSPFYRIIFGWVLPGLFYFGIFLWQFFIYGLIPLFGGILESSWRLYNLLKFKFFDGAYQGAYQGVDQGGGYRVNQGVGQAVHQEGSGFDEGFPDDGHEGVRADFSAASRSAGQNPFYEALTYVRMLEETRARNGYRHSWLYYQCVDDPVRLEAFYHLRDLGEIRSSAETSNWHSRYRQSYQSYRYQGDDRSRTNNSYGDSDFDGFHSEEYDSEDGQDLDDEGGDFEESREQQNRAESRDNFNPYSVLGISKSATKLEIRTKYREQMMLYHPDKVAHLGDELKEFALRKAQDLQKAYEMLKS